MLIRCAWCSKEMGEKPPLEDKSVTHTICDKCSEKMMEEDTMSDSKEDIIAKYNSEVKRAEKAYTDVLRETGNHAKAFDAENRITTEAQRESEAALRRLDKQINTKPKKYNTTDQAMNEVILYGGLPMTRASVYRQCLEDTGDADVADTFAFGFSAKLAPEGAEPLSREEFKKITEPSRIIERGSGTPKRVQPRTKRNKAKQYGITDTGLSSLR